MGDYGIDRTQGAGATGGVQGGAYGQGPLSRKKRVMSEEAKYYTMKPADRTVTPTTGVGGAEVVSAGESGGSRADRTRRTPGVGDAAVPGGPSPTGSQSGPGILEQWFNLRSQGGDPAFDYGLMRGNQQIENQYGAAGAFNSGAARQAEGDLYANLLSQRMGQLDQLAAGASGEHLGRLGLQFQQGLGLAGGQAGLASAYDLGAAGNMQAATQAQQQMGLNRAGVDQQGNQSAINLFSSIYGGKAGQ